MSTKVELSKRRILVNSSSSVVANVLNISVLLWLQQYLLKHISDEEYALYPVIMALMVFAPLISTLMISGLGRYVVEAYARGDERRVTQIVSTILPLLMVSGAALLGFGGLLAWHVDSILKIPADLVDDARIMLGLLVLTAAVRLAFTPFGVGLYVRQRFVTINVLALLTQVLRLALLFALLFGVSSRILWVVVATGAAELANLAITVALSRRAVPALRFKRSEITWSLAGQVLSFGAWNFLSYLSGMIQVAAHPLILNKFASANALACFHLGNLAHTKVDTTSVVASHTAQPALTALHATGSTHRLASAYLRGNRYALWITCLLAVPLMIFSRELILLYVGKDYLTAATVLLILFAQYPIWYPTLLLSRIAEATARIRRLSLYAVLSNTVTVGLSLYLVAVWQLGAIGAATARLAAAIGIQPLLIPLSLKLTGVSLRRWLRETVWLGLVPSLAATPFWLAAKLLVQPADWLGLAACVGCGAIVYLVTLFLFCLQEDERGDLLHVAEKLRLVRRAGQAA